MTSAHAKDSDNFKVSAVCDSCFSRLSTIDMNEQVDIYGAEPGAGLSIVVVHGGGASRKLYEPLARHLAKKGYRVVLPDLPGHGSRLKEPLTLQNAIQTLAKDVKDYTAPYKGVKPVYIGGSLGGYVGMELMGKYPDLFSGAIIAAATQTVGAGASVKAKMALGTMHYMKPLISSVTMAQQMVKLASSHKTIDKELLKECSVDPGFFFQTTKQQVAVLRATNSVEAMKKFHGPVLYLQGGKDHHDMEQALLAVGNKSSRPAVASYTFPDGDHFFSHDVRYVEEFYHRVDLFLEELLLAQMKR